MQLGGANAPLHPLLLRYFFKWSKLKMFKSKSVQGKLSVLKATQYVPDHPLLCDILLNTNFIVILDDLFKAINTCNQRCLMIPGMLSVTVLWCQFHQHFTSAFFVRKSFRQLFSMYLHSALCFLAPNLYKKLERKMLMKLTPARLGI